jgi:hypothetical protein
LRAEEKLVQPVGEFHHLERISNFVCGPDSGAGVGTYRQNARKSEGTKAADVTACSAFAKHFFARVPPTVPVRAVVFGGKGARAALTMPLIFRFLYLAQRLYR